MNRESFKFINYFILLVILVSNFVPVVSVIAESRNLKENGKFENNNLIIELDAEIIDTKEDKVDLRVRIKNKNEEEIKDLSLIFYYENEIKLNNIKSNYEKNEQENPYIQKNDDHSKLNIPILNDQELLEVNLRSNTIDSDLINLKSELFIGDIFIDNLDISIINSKKEIDEEPKLVILDEDFDSDSQDNNSNFQSQMGEPSISPSKGRGFEKPIYQSVHNGELYSTGNTNLKIVNEQTTAAKAFLNTRTAGSGYAINNFQLEFADVDGDSNTYNSSRAFIDLDGATEIAWAGLFWSASRYKGPGFSTNLSDTEITAPVQFTTPNGTVKKVLPEQYFRIDQKDKDPGQGFGYNNTGFSNFADVTDIIQSDKSNSGRYTLANIPMTKSLIGKYQSYNFSGWSLFIITKDSNRRSRAFNVYYGARGNAAGTNNEFSMNDFITAKEGPLDPIVTWFTVQGDKYWTGDNAQIKNNKNQWVNITNSINPVNNVMNGTVSDNNQHMVDKYPGEFDPSHPNFLDIDVDRLSLPEGLINNGQEKISFRTTSSGDDYSTNAIGFSVNAEFPELEIKKEIVSEKAFNDIGDIITYRVVIKNIKKDTESINTLSKDILDSRLDFIPGSIKIIKGPNKGMKSDIYNDDQAEFNSNNNSVNVRIGEGANHVVGGNYKYTTEETVYEFQAKINDKAKPGDIIPNTAHIDGKDVLTQKPISKQSNIVNVNINPKVPSGKLEATKEVNNAKPKIGEEIEYRITFNNKVPNSELKNVSISDTLPKGLTFVPGSLRSEGEDPKPSELTEKDGTITAKYPKITDTKKRSIVFKVKVNQEAVPGKELINKAKVADEGNPPEEPEVPIVPEVRVETITKINSINENQKPNQKVYSFLPKTGEQKNILKLVFGYIILTILSVFGFIYTIRKES